MLTVRQIERHWESNAYEKLFDQLVAARAESGLRKMIDPPAAIPAAALAIIRLDELLQSHAALYPRLVRAVLSSQEPDGGWGNLITTALCLRALLCGGGNGMAIDRGLTYLAALQKPDGLWPGIPIRRLPADAYVSAAILYELADRERFRHSIDLAQAFRWFEANSSTLDDETHQLWRHARLRCRFPAPLFAPSLC